MLDTLESNYIFYNRVMEHLGKAPVDRDDPALRNVIHTFSFNDVMEHLFGGDSRKEEAFSFAKTIHYRELAPFMRLEAGLIDTLDVLKPHLSLAVCTNRAISMDMIIGDFGLDGYFDLVMTASKVTNPKPHPEPLLKVLEHFGVKPGEAVFVGDGEVDMLAAKGAGIPFIAYKTDLPAVARIKHHEEILDHIPVSGQSVAGSGGIF